MSRVFNNNTSNFLSVAAAPVSGYPFSIAVWFKRNSATASADVLAEFFEDTGSPNGVVQIRWEGASGIIRNRRVQSDGTSASADTASGTTDTASWHLAVATFNTASAFASLDGTESSENTTSITLPTLDNMTVGKFRPSNGNALDGKLAYLAVYDKVISASEIDELLTLYPDAVSFAADLVGYWKMDTDTGATVPDEVGSVDLTVNGTVAFDSDNPSLSAGGGGAVKRNNFALMGMGR